MLELLRRYQKFLFIVITVVIVISFSFFGTYSAFSAKEVKDTVAFKAVDGSKVYNSELNDLMRLIMNSQQDFFSGSEASKGNSFNDGVIQKNICETGIVEVLAAPFLKQMSRELQARHEKEARFTPYAHPGAPFISAEQVWSYFAPDIKQNFDQLKLNSNPASMDAFSARVKLFLAEQRFPASYLKQLLKFQEREHSWLQPDEELPYRDLSLFGYHNVQDWFGKDFVELISKYIINCAKIAEQKGYKVTKDEVLQSLIDNVETSFKENRRNPYFNYPSFEAYFQAELQKIGMDQARLINAWKDVVLFRKLFDENKDAILVSDLPYKDFYRHMNEYVDVEVYKLPEEFALKNTQDLQKLEIYLSALRSPKDAKKGVQSFPPQHILSAQEVQKVFPELVEKRYRLRFASTNKDALETKIGVKNTWEWQVQAKNFEKLQKKFPELAVKQAKTEDERLNLLDAVDPKTRSLIDSYSRSQIIEEHPEWLTKAFDDAQMKDEVVEIREQGGENPFEGVNNPLELMKLLDQAPLHEASPTLSNYSQDGIHYYRIIVLEKPESAKILNYSDAFQDGTLDALLFKLLEGSYPRIRALKPESYVKDNGEWKPLAEVKEQVAHAYFEDLYKQLDKEAEQEKKEMPNFCDWNNKEQARIAVRLLPYMRKMWQNVKDHPEKISEWVQEGDEASDGTDTIADQFKLQHSNERVTRGKAHASGVSNETFALLPGDWLKPHYSAGTGIIFLKVQSKGLLSSDDFLRAKVLETREIMGQSLVQDLAQILLHEMQAKHALQIEEISPHAE
jgi:GcvH upstream region-like protein